MKFSSTLAAAALLLVGATSCKKDRHDQPPAPTPTETVNQKRLLKTSMIGGEFVMSYNADASIKEFTIQESANSHLRTTFAYNGNTVLQTRIHNDVKIWTYELTLSNNRIAKAVRTSFDNQGNITNTYVVDHYYNANGQLSMEEYSIGLREQYDYDVNGNLLESRTYEGPTFKYRTQYQYYLDKTEKPMSINLMEPLGWGGFRPMFSKNLRKRKTVTNMETQQVYFDAIYTYEFDADGYVSKGKHVSQPSGFVKEWTNVYQ